MTKTPVVTYALVVANVLATIFAHGGLWLLAGNMLFLWIFGTTSRTRWDG